MGENDLGNKLFNETKDEAKKILNFIITRLKIVREGDFEEGWKYYEYRNSKEVDFFKDNIEWTGEKLIKAYSCIQ